ncbi:GAF domain-containing protein [Parafrankia irregularis]|uniref:GAF domain-containing protein n=1 Tax=Parafrankia irregularis TaxID=795642 RepID=A0A0S4QPR6_9ACTN|nr:MULTISPECIES: LuxR C-terminal-related transcriptional regulator [Parafrankia]MBE3200282.1 GAF domain-containing protein [Parafrankia sp. CH37]CUU56518.1 GAF domain-containing protein [Parafrankia irregularis]
MRRIAYEQAFVAAENALRSATSVFGINLPLPRFGVDDPEQVLQALTEASAAVRATAGPGLAQAAELAAGELAAAKLDLVSWTALRGRGSPGMLARVLQRLRAATTVAELTELIPNLTAELGYDRVLLSWVRHGRWIPCAARTCSDPDEAAAIVAAGGTPAYRRIHGLLEDEVVRSCSTILVRDVKGNPRVHTQLLAVTHSRSYVAAPLVLRDQVVGLLHVDRNAETGAMDGFDRDLLALLSAGLGLALDRVRTLRDLETVRETVEGHAVMLHDLVGRLGNGQNHPTADADAGSLPISLSDGPTCLSRDPGEQSVNVARAVRPAHRLSELPDADDWKSGLTRREEQVLRLVAEGLTNAQIGERLFVTEATVKSHVKSLMRKLGAATRSEAGAAYHRGTDRALALAGTGHSRGQKAHPFG